MFGGLVGGKPHGRLEYGELIKFEIGQREKNNRVQLSPDDAGTNDNPSSFNVNWTELE